VVKTATVAELHERLDELLDAVRSGELVELRDEPGRIAQIVPASEPQETASDVGVLIAAGVISAPRTRQPLPADFFTRPRPRFQGSVLESLLQEREEGW
jgi:antitoxin (DNA-binding transcriptional repressor) of toxin-antitoxin stability system